MRDRGRTWGRATKGRSVAFCTVHRGCTPGWHCHSWCHNLPHCVVCLPPKWHLAVPNCRKMWQACRMGWQICPPRGFCHNWPQVKDVEGRCLWHLQNIKKMGGKQPGSRETSTPRQRVMCDLAPYPRPRTSAGEMKALEACRACLHKCGTPVSHRDPNLSLPAQKVVTGCRILSCCCSFYPTQARGDR